MGKMSERVHFWQDLLHKAHSADAYVRATTQKTHRERSSTERNALRYVFRAKRTSDFAVRINASRSRARKKLETLLCSEIQYFHNKRLVIVQMSKPANRSSRSGGERSPPPKLIGGGQTRRECGLLVQIPSLIWSALTAPLALATYTISFFGGTLKTLQPVTFPYPLPLTVYTYLYSPRSSSKI
jgi:hypothetical protein